MAFTAVGLNAVWSQFPAEYASDNTKTEFKDNKDLKQLFSFGVYEKAMVDTLEECYKHNTNALGASKSRGSLGLNDKNYEGDAYYGTGHFKHFKRLYDRSPKKAKISKQKGDLVPRYDMYGFTIADVKSSDITKAGDGWGVGTIDDAASQCYALADNKVFPIKDRDAVGELNYIAQYRAMSLVALFKQSSSWNTNLNTQWKAKCADFAKFGSK